MKKDNKKRKGEPKLYPFDRDMGKVWFVAFRFTNPETGQPKQFQFRGSLNEIYPKADRIKEGNAMIKAYSELLNEGWNPFNKEYETPTNHTLLKNYLPYIVELKRPLMRKSSHVAYRSVTNLFEKWIRKNCMYDIQLNSVTKHHAQKYNDHNISRGLSAHACNNHLSVMSSIFNELVDREEISINPFSKVKRQKEVSRENVAFTNDERNTIREHLKKNNVRLYYAVQFVYYCMLRRTDLMNLRVGDIDFINKTIRTRGITAKNGRSQSVTIPKSFEVILLEMGLDKADKNLYVFGKKLETCEIQLKKPDIFTDLHGLEIKKLNIRKECTFYCWKHTGAMNLYLATKDVYIVMNQCRHSDISTTMIYLRSLGLVVNEMVRSADFNF